MIDVNEALRVKDNFAKYIHVKSILIKGDPTKTARVSICIPTYKRVDTLRETIESCLNQVDFDDYLIIVSDNNPERNDETEQYMQTMNSSKILYYKHEENIGMYGNLNRLYQLSKSEYTVCIHDDDILLPHFLLLCFDVISKHEDIDILYPRKIDWREGKSKPIEHLKKCAYLYRLSNIDFIDGNPYPPTGFICRTQSLMRTGGYEYDTFPSNDYYFNVKAANILNVYAINQTLYLYRWAVNASLRKEVIEGFIKLDPPLIRWICHQYAYSDILQNFTMSYYSYWCYGFFKRRFPDKEPNPNIDPFIRYNKSKFEKKIVQYSFWLFVKYRALKHFLISKKVIISDIV